MEIKMVTTKPEVWGGIECTINRVGDQYKDQLVYSGHYDRKGDIQAIASLGIQSIRYPVLWEKHQPHRNAKIDWSWTERQLEAILSLCMKPIVGLVHHGSGPSFTHLLDPEFPYLLADFAYEVAGRFPWLEDYTPVNEPLTTARFSGLYGLWYPHYSQESAFYKILLNQLKATVLSMEAIRSINPTARLIQTEDLGKTHSTPLLAYQANFENERRWLTFDMLTGRVKPGQPQFEYMLERGISEEQLLFFQNHRTTPDMLGLNYYITSERWLDESLGNYPPETHGGNGIHEYADTEVVRANPAARAGFKNLGKEVWDRYNIPVAVTEAHLHCTREEQMRWFKEIWDDAVALRKEGVYVKAVTAWALLGSFDWDSLLTKTGTLYESGVFDIRAFTGQLRPTALARMIRKIASNNDELHPVLSEKGWWHPNPEFVNGSDRNLVIIGIENGLGDSRNDYNNLKFEFSSVCNHRRISHIIVNSAGDIDFRAVKPWAILDLSGLEMGIANLCAERNIQYVTFSDEKIDGSALEICVERLPMTVHQINKVLDLLIDGDTSQSVFDSEEIIFSTELSRHSRRIA